MHAGLRRLHRIALVVNRRRRTGEIVDLVDFNVERECDVVTCQFEMLVVQEMLNVLAGAGEKIVRAKDIRALCEQPLAQV